MTPATSRAAPGRRAISRPRPASTIPPANWWRNPQVSVAVKLSDAQFTALDAIDREHAAEVARLRMDAAAAERDVRLLLGAEHPTAGDIMTAGQRVRTLRDQILDHEVRMLADERALLTREQWTALQDALRDERADVQRPPRRLRRARGRAAGWWGTAAVLSSCRQLPVACCQWPWATCNVSTANSNGSLARA